ncbi:MAG TPA: HEAT repeat domain-containing protein [Candidatus Binatia bacterium]|nr:HEAT repeat domain-containing protein [Candidatus Binatia bacterium]
MNFCLRLTAMLLICGALGASAAAITGTAKSWAMLENGVKLKNTANRAIAVRALGLLQDDERARALAENALNDSRPEVRTAAVSALGAMHATQSMTKLQAALHDHRLSVVMAAAQALHELGDNTSAFAIYLDVLGGERKGDSLITEQMDTLRNPKELATIGMEQGMGYVPFAGIGWDAWRYTHKKNPHPPRAIAAAVLANDPDLRTGRSLVRAAIHDKDWIVRAAAVEAIARRGDPSLEEKLELCLFDKNPHVHYTAAEAVIRLSNPPAKTPPANCDKGPAVPSLHP